MGLRPACKQTEVGLIAEEWEVQELGSVSERITVGIASAATHAYRSKGVPLLRNQNIKAGYLDDSDVLYVDPAYESTFRSKRLREGDLLTARTGYPGVTCVVPSRYSAAQSFTTLITRPRPDLADSAYLCQFINSEAGQRFFEQSQIGGAQKNVNAGSLRRMPIPIPSLPEQRVIAKVLGDVDALLAALTKLIAKKRDLKQAAGQQLLTGHTRLPRFQGRWPFGDFASQYQRVFPRSSISSAAGGPMGAFPLFVSGGEPKWVDQPTHTDTEALIFSDGGVFDVRYYCGHFAVTDHCYVLSLKGNMRFFAEWIALNRSALDLQTFKGSGLRNLDKKALGKIVIPIPPAEEQAAIAAVLSDMDVEIAALEQQLAKTRALKQGMMQELLTGRTRLV